MSCFFLKHAVPFCAQHIFLPSGCVFEKLFLEGCCSEFCFTIYQPSSFTASHFLLETIGRHLRNRKKTSKFFLNHLTRNDTDVKVNQKLLTLVPFWNTLRVLVCKQRSFSEASLFWNCSEHFFQNIVRNFSHGSNPDTLCLNPDATIYFRESL